MFLSVSLFSSKFCNGNTCSLSSVLVLQSHPRYPVFWASLLLSWYIPNSFSLPSKTLDIEYYGSVFLAALKLPIYSTMSVFLRLSSKNADYNVMFCTWVSVLKTLQQCTMFWASFLLSLRIYPALFFCSQKLTLITWWLCFSGLSKIHCLSGCVFLSTPLFKILFSLLSNA